MGNTQQHAMSWLQHVPAESAGEAVTVSKDLAPTCANQGPFHTMCECKQHLSHTSSPMGHGEH
eukprot:3347955-Pyramimonas_sp.AAC.1